MKTFLTIILVIVVLAVGVVYYVFNRITYTPEWYENGEFQNTSEVIRRQAPSVQDVQSKLARGKEVNVKSSELESMILNEVQKHTSMNVNKLVKGLKVEVNENEMKIETVVNLKSIPKENIPRKAAEMFDMITSTLPLDALEEFYTCIEGKPVIRDGKLGFDDSANIQLGKVKYSLRELSSQMGQDNFIALDKLPVSNVMLQKAGLTLIPH